MGPWDPPLERWDPFCTSAWGAYQNADLAAFYALSEYDRIGMGGVGMGGMLAPMGRGSLFCYYATPITCRPPSRANLATWRPSFNRKATPITCRPPSCFTLLRI